MTIVGAPGASAVVFSSRGQAVLHRRNPGADCRSRRNHAGGSGEDPEADRRVRAHGSGHPPRRGAEEGPREARAVEKNSAVTRNGPGARVVGIEWTPGAEGELLRLPGEDALSILQTVERFAALEEGFLLHVHPMDVSRAQTVTPFESTQAGEGPCTFAQMGLGTLRLVSKKTDPTPTPVGLVPPAVSHELSPEKNWPPATGTMLSGGFSSDTLPRTATTWVYVRNNAPAPPGGPLCRIRLFAMTAPAAPVT